MSEQGGLREALVEALPCVARCYIATRHSHSFPCIARRTAAADALLPVFEEHVSPLTAERDALRERLARVGQILRGFDYFKFGEDEDDEDDEWHGGIDHVGWFSREDAELLLWLRAYGTEGADGTLTGAVSDDEGNDA